MLHHRTANEILTKVIREDQIERVVPDVACPNPGGLLLLVFVPKGVHHQRGREDYAALAILGRFRKVVTVDALKLLPLRSLDNGTTSKCKGSIQFCAEMCYNFTK